MKNTHSKVSILGIILVASCATEAPPPPPPPPPPAPKISMPDIIPQSVAPSEQSRSIHNMAGYFTGFADETGRAAANISSAQTIANSLDRSALFARSEMVDGAKAYALLAAAQTPEFRAGITQYGSPMGRAEFVRRMVSNPANIKYVPGYASAKMAASVAVTDKYSGIETSLAKIKQAAYDLQKVSWANVTQDKTARITAITTNYGSPLQPTGFDATTIPVYTAPAPVAAVPATNGTIISPMSPAPANNVSDRVLAAAALYAVRADAEALEMLKIGAARSCVFRAHLNIRMCMAATRYPFEHSFCLSEHGQKEALACAKTEVNEPVYVEYRPSIGARPTPPPPPPKAVPKAKAKAKKK